jgi:hypothetical protein
MNNNNKHYFYTSVWNKYVPVLRILIKKSATEEQLFKFNRIDFDRAGYARKSGYKFMVSFINNKPDGIFAGNELVQAFISVLYNDALIAQQLLNSNYTFTFSSNFSLTIKNDGPALKPEQTDQLLN